MALIKKLLGITRAPFLLLVPACLAPAFALAMKDGGAVRAVDAALVILAGLAAHISVNALNEYEDFRSGLDFVTERTPFSGGSGTLVAHPEFVPVALYVALGSLLATFTVGLYFAATLGWAVLVPGLAGLAIIAGYTRWLNRYPLPCLLAPGVGFGLIMVNAAYLVLARNFSLEALIVSVPVTLLVSNLLLVNQLPDVAADRRVGRRHLAIVRGPASVAPVSGALFAGTYVTLVAGVVAGVLPWPGLVALLTLPSAVAVVLRIYRFPENNGALVPALGVNVAVTLITPVLIAAGIALA